MPPRDATDLQVTNMTTDTMQLSHRAHVAFHLTGARTTDALHAIDGLRPALVAPYSDLTRLRYDFPVVLLHEQHAAPFASLSSLVDQALGKLAPATGDRERIRKLLLRHERAIRARVANGATGRLRNLWKAAAEAVDGTPDAEILAQAGAAIDCDGLVLDCDSAMPLGLFIRAWHFAQDRKSRSVRAKLDRLDLKLRDILRADFAASEAARAPQQLQASIGSGFEDAFDFERMSEILNAALPAAGLSASRRRRIEGLLRVLESQRFYCGAGESREPYVFVATSCAELESTYRERMPHMIELARAMAIAELETAGEYVEAQHDALFEAFGANGLATETIAQFPDYLLWISGASSDEYGPLMALLSADLPVKVLLQFDDLLEVSAGGDGSLGLSQRSNQLAELAMGLNTVYVLQSSASNLVRMKDAVLKGLAYSGPALFSVYSGAQPDSPLPAYLVSAAAMECRAFPAFTYDPSAGADWASRFSIDANTQPDADWPAQPFAYENAQHERAGGTIDFTLADFMACDARYARHFASVPAAQCNGNMLTVPEWLAQQPGGTDDRVPALMMVDSENVLQRVIVDSKAIDDARRCRARWRSLQELGGIHNSHAERVLAREKQAWEAQKQRETGGLGVAAPGDAQPAPAPAAAPTSMSAQPAVAEAAPAAAEPASDEPYIETPRCTTCEECVQINNKMFAYDANKQAYIADLAAGTYRQLVEAAESCQVSIIHPGKPRNASEPGLAELLERAAAFS